MLIALDYDDTFTRCPYGWSAAAAALQAHGHRIIGCTMRTPAERIGMSEQYFTVCDEVHFSSRQSKREYLASLSIHPHVWIDDTPDFICLDAADRLIIKAPVSESNPEN